MTKTTMLRAVAPISWSLARTYEVAYLAAEMIYDANYDYVTERAHLAGIYDPSARKHALQNFDRARRLADEHRRGNKFEMICNPLRKIEAAQAQILADAMAEARRA